MALSKTEQQPGQESAELRIVSVMTGNPGQVDMVNGLLREQAASLIPHQSQSGPSANRYAYAAVAPDHELPVYTAGTPLFGAVVFSRPKLNGLIELDTAAVDAEALADHDFDTSGLLHGLARAVAVREADVLTDGKVDDSRVLALEDELAGMIGLHQGEYDLAGGDVRHG